MTGDQSLRYPSLGGSAAGPLQRQLAAGAPGVALCDSCSSYSYYPRVVCPRCLAESVRVVAAPGPLRVLSHTYVHRVQSPLFADRVPALMLALADAQLQLVVEGDGWHADSPPQAGDLVDLQTAERADGSVVVIGVPHEASRRG